MAASPSFISTPNIGVATLDTAQTARTGGTTTNVEDVVSGTTNGTRVLEVVVKADDDPTDSIVVLWLHDGSTNHVFDEIDIGNPSAASVTVAGYRNTVTYSNLVIPNGWKLQASITATPTSGEVKVFALSGDL